ncbi:MAG: hypothetical protein ACK41T_00075 [Pseudobdellovibrio sp.]
MKYLLTAITILTLFSCAPVKFSKSDTIQVDTDGNGGTDTGGAKRIACNPRISPNATTYTYTSTGAPNILSQCDYSGLTYEWVVKRPDSSVVNTAIPGLSGANPTGVDFRGLGRGTYYVTLNARDPNGVLLPYEGKTPLEFIVPGEGTGNSLTCDPKLNSNQTSVVVNSTDSNPTLTANCNPKAGMYQWIVTKDGMTMATLPSGLSGESSTPDFKKAGAGTYKINLYATATGSAHWQSSTPLTVKVNAATPVPLPSIACSPKVNGSATTITITNSSLKPLVEANCNPSAVNYAWSVTRNGQTIPVADLNGASSNPDFLNLGSGTYLVYLTATKNGYTTWSTTNPLSITVDKNETPALNVNCSPRFGSGTGSTAVTITANSGNTPLISNCNPSSAQHTWTVYRNGQTVTVPSLSGSSSTPDFLSLGIGTYYVYLTASQSGYNSYVIPSPLQLTVGRDENLNRRVTLEKTVKITDNAVDLLLVVDDSKSMLEDNRKLANRLQGFVTDLSSSNIDWQMCTTVTRAVPISGVYHWGASAPWTGYLGSPRWILKAGATDPNSIFKNTIESIGAGWEGTDDERAIKAAYWHAEYATSNTCYRNEASLAVIIISDEDERSVGGDASQVFYPGELKPLETDDLPQSYINKVKQKFGMNKRFTVNSIIVKPGDTSCMSKQDQQEGGKSKSHYGYKYHELSQLTNGVSTSICENDYSTNLKYFKDRIVTTLGSIPLECTPVGVVDVTITPSMGGVSTRIENNSLIFTPAVPVGHKIKLAYDCPKN